MGLKEHQVPRRPFLIQAGRQQDSLLRYATIVAGISKNKIWKYYISFILIAGKTIEKTGCCIRCQKIIGNRSYRLLLLSHIVDILNGCDKIKESRAWYH